MQKFHHRPAQHCLFPLSCSHNLLKASTSCKQKPALTMKSFIQHLNPLGRKSSQRNMKHQDPHAARGNVVPNKNTSSMETFEESFAKMDPMQKVRLLEKYAQTNPRAAAGYFKMMMSTPAPVSEAELDDTVHGKNCLRKERRRTHYLLQHALGTLAGYLCTILLNHTEVAHFHQCSTSTCYITIHQSRTAYPNSR